MSYSHILFDVYAEGIARITVNRPDKLNALNRETMNELADAFARAQSDAAVRGVILTGAGEKAFVAGADINELAVLTPIEAQALSLRGQAILRALECMPPSVAALNGFALGGGLELAMACTIRIA
jgi:enoyl-CoA hydratase